MIYLSCYQTVTREAFAALLREFSYTPTYLPAQPDWSGVDMILAIATEPAPDLIRQLKEAREHQPTIRLVGLVQHARYLPTWQPLEPDGLLLQDDTKQTFIDAVSIVLDGRMYRSANVLRTHHQPG